jgi:carboxymethylenebutenolidase
MKSSTVEVAANDGGKFKAHLAEPEGAAKAGVVVLQEIFGINANIRGVAAWLAESGYAAIAPDLFWRQEPGVELNPANADDRERATTLMKGVDPALAVADALAAASTLKSRLGGSARIGAAGYCFGGKLAFLLATRPEISACVSYYGVAIQASLNSAAHLCRPLLLHIAGNDHLCPPEAQQAIKQAFKDKSDLVTIMEYPGAAHAFARRGGAAFDAQSAQRADGATLAFLDQHLRV